MTTPVHFTNLAVPTALEFDIAFDDRDLPCEELVGYPSPPFRVRVNEELMLCLGGVVGSVLADCDRGVGGTFPVAHSAGAFVEHVVTADDIALIYSHEHAGGTETYLPLAGGSMTGSITFDPGTGIVENNASHGLALRLGRRTTGASGYGTPFVDFHSGGGTGPQGRIILNQNSSLTEGTYAGKLWYRAGEHQYDGIINAVDGIIVGAQVNMNTHVLTNPANPTSGAHVGDRAYNDGRYSMQGHDHTWGSITSKPSTFPPDNHGDGRHSEDYSKTGHTHTYGSITGTHGNAEHSTDYAALSGADFTGTVIFNSTTLRWDNPRKDSDGGQPTIRIYASGTKYMYEHSSALAWKRDVETDVDRLADAALRLRPVSYLPMGGATLEDAEPGKRRTIGFVAEEVAEVLPEVTSKDDEGNAGHVSYDILSTVAIAAIQKLDERVKALEDAS